MTEQEDGIKQSKKSHEKKDKQVKNAEIKKEAEKSHQSSVSIDESQDRLMEHVQKRLRNLIKRKQKLEKYAEIAANPSSEVKLNADQLAALADKSSVEAPLKEINDIMDLYKAQLADLNMAHQKELQACEAKHKQEISKVKKQAQIESRQSIDLVLQFLRAASIKRAIVASVSSGSVEFAPVPEEEFIAFENLLQRLYAADAESLKSVELLVQGSKKPVKEGAITYELVKEISSLSVDDLYDSAKKPEPVVRTTANGHVDPVNGITPSTLQISFLQEEVTEEEGNDESNTTTSDVVTESETSTPGTKKKRKWPRNKKNKQATPEA